MSYIKVRVQAGAKKELVVQKDAETYMIAVKEKAERGAANKRVRELVATACGVATAHVRLVKGATTPSKVYSLRQKTYAD